LRRLLEEEPNLTIEEAALAASSWQLWGGCAHEEAFSTLSTMAERTSRAPPGL
jgi:hypothetical protein